MTQYTEQNKMRIMMIYGWKINPYIEYVVQSLVNHDIEIALVTQRTLELNVQNKNYAVYKIFPNTESTQVRHLLLLGLMECTALLRLAWLLLFLRPHVIHFVALRIPYIDWIFFLLLKILKKKVVFTIHDTRSQLSPLEDFILSKIANHCHALFVHSSYSRNIIHNTWSIDISKIFIVPHGGYNSNITCISKEISRKHLKYKVYDYILLFFGRIEKYKGLDYLIESIGKSKETIPNIKLIIAGNATNQALGEYYRQLINKLELQNEVNYQNRYIQDEEVASFFSCCDVVVLPYTQIDQSGVLCLSYTFGKPVIATQIGGFPEMVQDGETGYLIRPADTDALVQKIIDAWHNRLRLKQMGCNAQKLLQEEYSWDRLAVSTIHVYRNLLPA